jgi:Histidine kinase-, DNA gyrase B-, and HSP90-like ATPase
MSSTKRPEFTVTVQSGILQSLGIDMYSTLGKCLVEFVANAYDGEASKVEITIPFKEIDPARVEVRRAAKERVAKGEIDPFTLLNEPLPKSIVVSVKDDGSGMTPDDVQSKFLPITRNRRLDAATGKQTRVKSETGKRFVMGRKGLGKLAGFGVAECIEITTKREGDDFATVFSLDQDQFSNIADIAHVKITPSYKEGQNIGEHYTEIRLSRLKCDAVRHGDKTLKKTMVDNFFGIKPDDFAMLLNGEPLLPPETEYDLQYPPDRGTSGMATSFVEIDEGSVKIPFDYVVKFRKPGDHLQARHRGALIYCTGRLAAGPTLLNLPTGMHSFHSTDYMECTVVADELDRHGVDLINTNRTQLKENNELVQVLLDKITEIMAEAVRAHGKHREAETEKELEAHPDATMPLRIVEQLPSKQRRLARRLIGVVAQRFSPGTEEFKELAPLIVQSMNATEVLIRLTEAGSGAKEISEIGELLRELAEVERSDVLKLYRGRRSGITALEMLIAKGEDYWRKKQFEDELHDLLKANPWLIRPEYSRYLTSNQTMGTVATELAKYLSIDEFASAVDQTSDERPDLAFAMADATHPHEIHIVELKSPALPLAYAHLDQLRDYMFKTEEFLRPRYSHPLRVFGTLIGTRPPATTTAEGSRRLNDEIAKKPTNALWEVLDIREVLSNSRRAHLDEIKVLEDAEREGNAEEAEAVAVKEREPKKLADVKPRAITSSG